MAADPTILCLAAFVLTVVLLQLLRSIFGAQPPHDSES